MYFTVMGYFPPMFDEDTGKFQHRGRLAHASPPRVLTARRLAWAAIHLCLVWALAGWLRIRGGVGAESLFGWTTAPLGMAALAAAMLALRPTGRLALASTLLTVACAEAVAFGIRTWTEPAAELEIDAAYYQFDPLLGYAPLSPIRTRARKRVEGRTLYDVTYEIDDHGRRVTPARKPGARARFLLFFGGSFAFGEGVDQHETLPFYAGEQLPDHRPYNYGFHGYGPQHLLARLEAGGLRGEVAERDGALIYLFIDSHIHRAIGSFVVHTGWAESTPYYILDAQGLPRRRGNLTTGRPLTALAYSILGQSEILRWLRFEIPRRIEPRHVEHTAAILARAAELFHEQFGSRRFYVVISPGSVHGLELSAALERRGVASLDYSRLLDYSDARFFIADDWHPTALTHRALAAQIARDLGPGARKPLEDEGHRHRSTQHRVPAPLDIRARPPHPPDGGRVARA